MEFNRRRVIQGYKILVNQVICENRSDNVYNKYRIASRVCSYMGALGQKYLEQNWEQDIMNKRESIC